MARRSLPEEVAAVLECMLAGVRERLGERALGLHLYGSLATGDFDSETSDIDFVVTTDGELGDADVAALGAMHAALRSRGGLFAALEGSYVPCAALRRWDPAHAPHPHLSHDRPFGREPHGPDWVIQRQVLREHGITIAGPDAKTWIDPVSPADLRAAVAAVLDAFWRHPGRSQAFLAPRAYQVFAVQTMARALFTLEHGDLVSKPAALRWALDALPERFRAQLERALAFPDGDQRDDLPGTRALIDFTVERATRPR
jgi:predicted nucleotidyltransferase